MVDETADTIPPPPSDGEEDRFSTDLHVETVNDGAKLPPPGARSTDDPVYAVLYEMREDVRWLRKQLSHTVHGRLAEGDTLFRQVFEAFRRIHSHLTCSAIDQETPPTSDSLDGEVILIVDDYADLRNRLVQCCEACGAEATGVGSVAEAQRYIKNIKPTAAVVDVFLPDGSGLQVAFGLRFHSPDVRLVLLSGWRDADIEASASQLGARLVEKPTRFGPILDGLRVPAKG